MTDRGIYGAWIVGTALIILSLVGCATFKADAKAAAEVCRPELAPDAEQALPYVLALIDCEIAHTDCTVALDALKAQGKADAVQCAVAEAHAVTVKLAADAGAP